jgi:hypothetical protein
MSNVLSPLMKQQFIGPTGAPIAFGLLYSYQAGTATPLTTYNASGAANANPVVLDASGRADVWVPPNVAYKFNLTDAAGNQIPGWPLDNIVNSQLITLYGGVDTGGANAYAINFTANFSSLQNGILIYFVPSHTSTGPSTINVNGLGVVSITHSDGSAIIANDFLAGDPAGIFYYNGAWILLTGAYVANLYAKGALQSWGATASAWVDASADYGSFTPTWTGFSSSPSGVLNWVKMGNLVLLYTANAVSLTGTSNATTMQITNLPAEIQPANGVEVPCVGVVDNGTHDLYGSVSFVGPPNASILNFELALVNGSYIQNKLSSFTTGSATKGINGFSCIYPLK